MVYYFSCLSTMAKPRAGNFADSVIALGCYKPPRGTPSCRAVKVMTCDKWEAFLKQFPCEEKKLPIFTLGPEPTATIPEPTATIPEPTAETVPEPTTTIPEPTAETVAADVRATSPPLSYDGGHLLSSIMEEAPTDSQIE